MSRVFVSYADRDRAVGERISHMLVGLAHEPVDARGDSSSAAWWNEVAHRIETCAQFVAVVSPAYVEARTCRLAASCAAEAGIPVVRLDVTDKRLSRCPPVVMAARPVRFDPDDLWAPAVLAAALARAADDEVPGPQEPPAPPPARGVLGRLSRATGRSRQVGIGAAILVTAMVMVAAALVAVGLLHHGGLDDDAGRLTTGPASSPGEPTSAPTAGPAESATASPVLGQLLSAISAAGSTWLPASSCSAGEGQVTCRRPASNIQVVVLRPYGSQRALYDAYTQAVRELSGDRAAENTGDCSGAAFEGELAWNLDLEHRQDISVDQQAAGGLDPATEAAGRVFCTESSDVLKLVWTQDPGLLVTATGQPARLTIGWWHEVHIALACSTGESGSASGCG